MPDGDELAAAAERYLRTVTLDPSELREAGPSAGELAGPVETEPEQGAFCSNACRHIWRLQCLPRIRRESVYDANGETKAVIKLGHGCYMRTNLQNEE